MNLQELKDKAKELNNLVQAIKPEVKVVNNVLDVFPGDVWFYPPNNKISKARIYYTVVSVDKEKNEVRFDKGWNYYDKMFDEKWVLVARTLTDELKKLIES